MGLLLKRLDPPHPSIRRLLGNAQGSLEYLPMAEHVVPVGFHNPHGFLVGMQSTGRPGMVTSTVALVEHAPKLAAAQSREQEAERCRGCEDDQFEVSSLGTDCNQGKTQEAALPPALCSHELWRVLCAE